MVKYNYNHVEKIIIILITIIIFICNYSIFYIIV